MPVLLEPMALLWRLATWLRWHLAKPYRSPLPVICIGSLTAGGAGKTPTAIAIAEILKSEGERPVFLTRGYGGKTKGPHRVDPVRDGVRQVGDEALLLARSAPAIVCADRVRGARFAVGPEASVIVMDDGFQNPHLAKDLSILVVDRASGVGNGLVIPAGPLRASIASQLARAQAILLLGEGGAGDEIAARARVHSMPVFSAALRPSGKTLWLKGKPVVAFAGIGDPKKFFRTLEQAGARLAKAFAFPDHHDFTEKDAQRLLHAAAEAKAALVTTEKDHVRLGAPSAAFQTLRSKAYPLPVTLAFSEPDGVKRLVRETLAARRAR